MSGDQIAVRAIEELVDTQEPGISLVREWLKAAVRSVRLLAVEPARGQAALLALQVTSRSPMGALALETGGVLVDDGFVRVLGGGCEELQRSIDGWNRITEPLGRHRLPGALLLGDDVLGGFFALNGGAFEGSIGQVFYFAPDTCEWECLELGYSEWLVWLAQGELDSFYESFAWEGWRDECAKVGPSQAINFAPPLPLKPGNTSPERSRRPVPVEEQWIFSMDLATQLAGLADGARVVLKVTE